MNKKSKALLLLVLTAVSLLACRMDTTVVVSSTNTPIDQSSLFATPVISGVRLFGTQTALAFNLGANPVPDPKNVIVLYLILPNDSRIGFTINDLEELPGTTITLGGQERHGVRMIDILGQVGEVGDIFSVTIEGKGSLTIPASTIAEDDILMFNDQGMVDFISPTVDLEDSPRDVLLITLR